MTSPDLKPCCSSCENLGYESPQPDQPYPEIWCMKGHFDCPSSLDELHEPINCKDYTREDNK